ncbi:MAG: hypothetical protein SGJ13_16870 [Actinomycetota bacterium]|nr:hypothetical protein [Actinomycetota bacterium]
MTSLGILASELTHKTLWNPTILGVLVFLSAIGLFCGSVYLLLATNLGARLGFLISISCLSGFMVLLASLWITTQTPLNSPKGIPPEWEAKEVVTDLADSEFEAVRSIAADGRRVENVEDLGELRPGAEAGLVIPTPEGEEEVEVPPTARFDTGTDFLTDFSGFETFLIGGGSRRIFQHEPQFAAVQFCPKLEVVTPPGATPDAAACDPLAPKEFVVMQYNYGSLRQPPWIYFAGSLVIFIISLLCLHWYEQDQRAQRRRSTELAPVPTPGA